MSAIEPTCPHCNSSLVDQVCTVCKPSKAEPQARRRGCDEFDDGEDLPRKSSGNPWNGYWPPGNLTPFLEHPSVNERY